MTRESITSADGRTLDLRPIRANDVAALQRGFANLTPEEVRMRFLHPLNELTRDAALGLCDVDPRYAAAWVLADPDGTAEPEIHAVARIHLDRVTEQAEFAVVVQHALAGQGLGSMLMRRVIESARKLGAIEIWGDVLMDNSTMLHVCEKFGFRHGLVPHNPGVQRVTLALDTHNHA